MERMRFGLKVGRGERVQAAAELNESPARDPSRQLSSDFLRVDVTREKKARFKKRPVLDDREQRCEVHSSNMP